VLAIARRTTADLEFQIRSQEAIGKQQLPSDADRGGRKHFPNFKRPVASAEIRRETLDEFRKPRTVTDYRCRQNLVTWHPSRALPERRDQDQSFFATD
jgi:hypothetical protein